MGNRNGLAVDAKVELATGTAEREAAFAMAGQIPGDGRVTLGGDKNYDTAGLVEDLRGLNVTPHVAQNDTHRRSVIERSSGGRDESLSRLSRPHALASVSIIDH